MKNSTILLLLIVIGGTIGLFWLLGPEVKTNLFYFNLGFTLLLEIIFFGTIFSISGQKLFNIPGMATGVQITRYVIFAALIMIAFNLMSLISADYMLYVKWYFGVLILLTIIYAIIVIFTIQGGQYQLQMRDEIEEKTERKTDISLKHNELSDLFKNKTAELNVDYSILKECKNNIRLISDKASMISISKISKDTIKTQDIANEIENLSNEIRNIDISAEKNEIEKLLQIISKNALLISNKISNL